jgi:sec-independent protein translocase protein TatA
MFEGFLAPSHVLMLAVIALLLFGDRLPEVMRSVGRGVMEFKKGMRGIESAIEAAAVLTPSSTGQSVSNQSSMAPKDAVNREAISAPRFDPPTTEPRAIEGSVHVETASSDPAPPV